MTYTENREHMRSEHLLLTSYRRLCKDEKEDEKENENNIVQPTPKEIVDKWLAEVPDIAQAHRLKEDFSDILQLMDETRDLIAKPQDTPEWLLRFKATERVEIITEVDEPGLAPDVTEESEMVEENQQLELKSRSHRPFRFNPGQGKLF
jgi:hypothetical protein